MTVMKMVTKVVTETKVTSIRIKSVTETETTMTLETELIIAYR